MWRLRNQYRSLGVDLLYNLLITQQVYCTNHLDPEVGSGPYKGQILDATPLAILSNSDRAYEKRHYVISRHLDDSPVAIPFATLNIFACYCCIFRNALCIINGRSFLCFKFVPKIDSISSSSIRQFRNILYN
jgi:hypothetical protein